MRRFLFHFGRTAVAASVALTFGLVACPAVQAAEGIQPKPPPGGSPVLADPGRPTTPVVVSCGIVMLWAYRRIVFKNIGEVTVPAGWKAKWVVEGRDLLGPKTYSGVYVFQDDLEPGAGRAIDVNISPYTAVDTPCVTTWVN